MFYTKISFTSKTENREKGGGMVNLEEFRTGSFGVPFSCADELPACCFRCWHLIHEESQVCYCEAPFYYYCCYSWPDKLTESIPPCLAEAEDQGSSKNLD